MGIDIENRRFHGAVLHQDRRKCRRSRWNGPHDCISAISHEIRNLPGCKAVVLYEDDGETYRYERGERATVALRWDDARRTLHIGARQGRFPGLVTHRTLRVRVMATPDRVEQTRSVQYKGRALALSFDSRTDSPSSRP